MTGSASRERFWVRFADGERWAATADRWRTRLRWFAAPEVVISSLIVVFWALLATVGRGSAPVLLAAVAISLWVHLAAVESGNHSLTWVATGLVLLLTIAAATTFFGGLEPISYTLAALVALAHNELVRLNLARRRSAVIDEDVYVASAISLAMVGLVSGVGIGVAQFLTQSADRSWLWMAATAGVLTVAAVLLTTLPGRKGPPGLRDRWRPGDRIPPQPLGEVDLS